MLRLLSIGHSFATNSIDNNFLESLETGTNVEWIIQKIGIVERVSTLPIEYIRNSRNQDPRLAVDVATDTTVSLACRAIDDCLTRAGIQKHEVSSLICNTCTPNSLLPIESAIIAEKAGLDRLDSCFELMSACPAFALHVHHLNSAREDSLPKYTLCVSTATFTQKVNYCDRTDGAIWGDGASAYLLSTQVEGRLRVLHTTFTADPMRSGAVVLDRYGHFRQDGRAVRDFSVRQTVRLLKELEEKFSLDWSRDIFIGHQANRTMLEQIANNRRIGQYNHWHNVTYLGNQAASGAPSSLANNWDKIQRDQKIAVAVVGAGLSWGSVLLEGC